MSATFTRRARAMTFGGLATLGLAALAQLAVSPAAMSADTEPPVPPYDVSINIAKLGATADSQGCTADDMNDVPSDKDGWLFVASPDNFDTFQAIFDTGTVTLANQGDTDATKWFSKEFEHLVVVTPAGATLQHAYATLSGDRDFFTLSHTCAASTQETPSPTPSVSESPSESPSETPSQTPSETVSETPSQTPSETVSETPSQTPSETVSETPSETVSETPSETVSETPSETVSETPSETASETPSAEVSGTVLTQSPSGTPEVKGVRVTRKPAVEGSRLPSTGSPLPIGLLLLLGFGLVGAGVVVTVTGEPHSATPGGKHRA